MFYFLFYFFSLELDSKSSGLFPLLLDPGVYKRGKGLVAFETDAWKEPMLSEELLEHGCALGWQV